jgi:hypothetical protein
MRESNRTAAKSSEIAIIDGIVITATRDGEGARH